MRSCIVAINSGHEKFMGYAFSHSMGSLSLKSSNLPVFKSGNNMLVGVAGEERLLTDLKLSTIIIGGDLSISQAMAGIRNSIKKGYSEAAEVLILTTNNFIYRWHQGLVDVFGEFDEPYMAIGLGSDVALGALYGMKTSRYTVSERMEVCFEAIKKYYPELGLNTGYFNI